MNIHRKPKIELPHFYGIQILFALAITLGSQSFNLEEKHNWITIIARYVIYILTIQATKIFTVVVYDMVSHKRGPDLQLLRKVKWNQLMIYGISVAIVCLNNQRIFAEDFLLVFFAYLIVNYPEMDMLGKAKVTYGAGMACSYIEGYLMHIIPSDGGEVKGFLDKIRVFQDSEGVVFPVKRMFIIITKSMHCPPDLMEFNDKSENENVSRLESCKITVASDNLQSFEKVVKNVAGVKNRIYKNSAYKVRRAARRPVYVAAECATPLHTLYRVVQNKALYDEWAEINVEDVVSDFISMLRTVLDKSPELKNKCELIYFDDTDESLNLADVLLDRIREIEPEFEEVIKRKN